MTENWTTPDLCDAHPDDVRVVHGLQWQSYGGRRSFGGPLETVKCFEDNSRVKEQLATRGEGKVLVVDGGGSLRNALIGDMIAEKAVGTGWAGVVIFGVCRDVDALAELDIGIVALGCVPIKSVRRAEGQLNVPVHFGGVTFAPGESVYVDANGIIVAGRALA
ncbi:MAG: ribonuclease E activity regulator RraA [Wenzhouxiangellaceae bacterium]